MATWTALLFSSLFFLVSCQVKETSDSGGLISGHVPVTNSFGLNAPAPDTLVTGDTLNLVLSFPYNVAVDTSGGTPFLSVTIGSTTRNATYASGAGTKSLTFTYTILPADNDGDGVTFNAINLNGGTLKFSSNGVPTNCSTTLASRTFTSLLVDNSGPTITAFSQSNLPGYYRLGDTLNFVMNFSEAVVVTGTPRIQLGFSTGGPVYATYAGGSGTSSLHFSYTIASSVADTDGYLITSPVDLNGGALKDAAGNTSAVAFAGLVAAVQTYSSTVDFDGRLPFVTTVTPPPNGNYAAAQDLDVRLEFNRAVTVTGSPYIGITIGSTLRQATYLSGTGTNTLVFRYTTIPGDVDTDGISITASITQNSGNITGSAAPTNSFFTQVPNNVLTVPSTTSVRVGATQPQAVSVTRNVDSTNPIFGGPSPDNVWMIGQTLFITVGFNTGIIVNQTLGTPRIPITIGATTKYATYLSGGDGQTSLVFTYSIIEGDLDTDGSIALGSIDLNGGTMTDAASTNALLTLPVASISSTTIDGVRPTISSVTAPANGTYSQVNLASFDFTVTWSEAVNYSSNAAAAAYISLNIGGSTVNAVWESGANSTTFIHAPASLAGTNDNNGIAVNSPFAGTGTFRDAAGNSANVFTFTPPVTTGVLIDTTAPTVSSISAQPADDTYLEGEDLDFDVTFSEPVTTSVSGGFPRIALTVGGATRYLVPTSSTTASIHTFRYTVVNGDNDTDGVVMGNSVQNGAGYARDAGLNNVTGTFTPPATTGILADAVQATVSSVTKPANGTYTSGDVLQFSLAYTENITVTGTPRIQVAAQTGTLNFNYSSGSGSNTLIFEYTVTTNDFDFDGLPSAISSVALNGGTLADPNTVPASTSFTVQNLSSVFLAYPGTQVWVTSTLTNRAPTGSTTLSSTGASTTQACGTGTCRTFDGDDSLSNTTALTGVETAFIVFRAPAALSNQDIISADVSLVDDSTTFDLGVDADININSSTSSGTTHDVNLATSSTNILQVDFTSPQNYPGGVILPTSFSGAIGEVILINGTLTNAQKTEIRNYLNSKY